MDSSSGVTTGAAGATALGHHPSRGPRHDLARHPGLRDPAAPLPVGPGHVGRPEPGQRLHPALEEPGAWLRGQLVGVRHAEHAAALHGGEGAQTDAVRQVTLQRVHAPLVEPLRGQQQMHPQRPPEPSDHHEQVHELAVGGQQFAELVDDHEEAGERFEGCSGRPCLLVLQGRAVVPGGPQQLLAADEFTMQGVLHALHEGDLVGEVGDDGGGVRQPVESEEGGPALEVDEHEVQGLGGVRQGQPQHQRAQQFALAGPRGPDEHAVRSHAALRGLLDVQFDGPPVGAHRDRHPQPGRPGGAPPQGRRVVPVQVGDAEQGGQLHITGERFGRVRAQAHPVRRQQPGQCLGPGPPHRVGPAQRGGLLLAAAVGAHQPDRTGPHVQTQGGPSRPPAERPGQVEDDGVAGPRPVQPVTGRHRHAVQHDHGERLLAAREFVGVEGGPLGELRAQQFFQVGEDGGHHPRGPGAVPLLRMQVVGQPLGPLPLAAALVGDAQRDPQVLGGVEHRELAQRGPHERAYGVLVAPQQHP
ncbi:hypothetical protein RKD19_000424 [Streptomyces canus]